MPGIDRATVTLLAVLIVLSCSGPRAARGDAGDAIRSRTIEVGANGSFTSVEGTSSGGFGLHAGYFAVARATAGRFRVRCDYARVSDLDRLGLEGAVHLLVRAGDSSAYPYVGLALGVSQEWIGSFSQSRYPAGIDAGVTALVNRGAALGVAYEFRRFFGDPVSDFNEHRVVFGLSILFRNDR